MKMPFRWDSVAGPWQLLLAEALTAAFLLNLSHARLNAADPTAQLIIESLNSYAEGNYDKAVAQLSEVARDSSSIRKRFQREAAAWISGAESSDLQNRRRRVSSIVTLEIVKQVLSDDRLDRSKLAEARRILEDGCELIRRGDPSSFEHVWLLASVALLHGVQNFGGGGALTNRGELFADSAHLRHAIARFPDEARFPLAQVLTRPEARRMPNRPNTSAYSMLMGLTWTEASRETQAAFLVKEAIDAFTKLLTNASISSEVRLRRGILQFHRGDLPASFLDMQAATTSDDPHVAHVAHLYLGRLLDSQGRRAEAILAYESALRIIPNATSAALALAANLFITGHHEEASTLLQATFRSTGSPDPWHELSSGDYRFWPGYLMQLRTSIHP
jgi:tetratricopeptide (TPR) repeat protein